MARRRNRPFKAVRKPGRSQEMKVFSCVTIDIDGGSTLLLGHLGFE